MLEIEGLNAGYGEVQVLWDVKMKIPSGSASALVGSNGAGKSTLLKTICGLVHPWSGQIRWNGVPLVGLSSDEIVRRGITQVPEGRRLFGQMSVEENLLMGAYRRRDAQGIKQDLEWVYSLFPVLSERHRQAAGSLSGGEQQMCAIGRGLMARPELLLIDEMSLGLAPVVVDQLLDTLAVIHRNGTTVLLVEQDVQIALENSDHGYVLSTGTVIMEGESAALLADQSVVQAYLGL